MIDFGNDWNEVLGKEFDKDYYKILRGFLKDEYANEIIHPDMYDIFNAFKYTAYGDVKVVVIGQDPYYTPHLAHGLAFSVKPGIRVPASLRNIYREQQNDVGTTPSDSGCLIPWAKQGVLLLNTILTVREGKPMSHKGRGWEQFTDAAISALNKREKPLVVLAWGSPAKKKAELFTDKKHLILEAPHPSPLSAYYGFFGCKHFSKANEFLSAHGDEPINWQI